MTGSWRWLRSASAVSPATAGDAPGPSGPSRQRSLVSRRLPAQISHKLSSEDRSASRLMRSITMNSSTTPGPPPLRGADNSGHRLQAVRRTASSGSRSRSWLHQLTGKGPWRNRRLGGETMLGLSTGPSGVTDRWIRVGATWALANTCHIGAGLSLRIYRMLHACVLVSVSEEELTAEARRPCG